MVLRGLLLWTLLLAGCELTSGLLPTDSLPASTAIPTTTPVAAVALEQSDVMRGICFEAAFDAADQVFVLRSAEEHIRFYDLADNSRLCSQPVERVSFDFDSGRILAGLWNKGIGCTARHVIDDVIRDDDAKQVILNVRFITEGDCGYELVRPFWLALDGVADYAIDIRMTQ
jgi:hypothetical protein